MIDIYTIRYCPYCQDAKELLAGKGIEFHEIDASGNHEIRKEMMARANGRSIFRRFLSAPPMSAAATISMRSTPPASSTRSWLKTNRVEPKRPDSNLKEQPA